MKAILRVLCCSKSCDRVRFSSEICFPFCGLSLLAAEWHWDLCWSLHRLTKHICFCQTGKWELCWFCWTSNCIYAGFVGPATFDLCWFCQTSDFWFMLVLSDQWLSFMLVLSDQWSMVVFVRPVTGNYAAFVGPVTVFMLVLSDQQLDFYCFCPPSDCDLCWFRQTSDCDLWQKLEHGWSLSI